MKAIRGFDYYCKRLNRTVKVIAPHPDDGALLIVQVLDDPDNIDDYRSTTADALSIRTETDVAEIRTCWHCNRPLQDEGIQKPITDQGHTATFCGLPDCEKWPTRNNGIQYDNGVAK